MNGKKLLYVAFMRLPTEKAHGLQIVKTCEAFAEQGIDVELVVPNRKTPITKDPFTYYHAKKNFTLTVLETPDWVQYGPLGYTFSALWFSEHVKWRRQFWNAEVVYSRDAWVLLQYLFLGKKLVFEAHRNPTLIDRIVARASYKVVTITESLKKRFVAHGVPAEKIVVAHDGVEPIASTKTKKDLGIAPTKPLVVYAGSRKPGKGVETVERAQALLAPDIEVMIVEGRSPLAARETLAAADVVLVPNSALLDSSAVYTSPMKLFEALSSGARIVASDVPAIREVVDASVAYLCVPDDPASLVVAVRQALSDPEAQAKVAAAQALAQRYTWDARAKQILSFIIPRVGVQ